MTETRKDFKDTPSDQYKYWNAELTASNDRLKKWHKKGDAIVNLFANQKVDIDSGRSTGASDGFKLNLFHSNIITLGSLLYGNLPKVDVSRKFADSNDDTARVAAEMMERLLNADIANNGEEYNAVLRGALQDRLLPGLGVAKADYKANFDGKELKSEEAPVEYFFWRDVCWGWSRSYAKLPWMAFRSYLSKDQAEEAFGEDVAGKLQYKKQTKTEENEEADESSHWSKAEVWEIWDKTKRQVIWVSLGYEGVLETKEDFLKLSGFFPAPPFFIANATTSLYMPTPDYSMAQDLYNEVDILQTRIAVLTEAVKAVGVYDAAAEGISRMFDEGVDNELIPVDNWALFAEKGGIQGSVQWVPVADIVVALDKLRSLRDETIGLLQQVTGMSDIMQGGLNNQYEGVGQSQIKAKFGSIRIQKMQEEFAQFASDLMQIKAEIVARHFQPETIVAMSNMVSSHDVELIPQAIKLLKDPDEAKLRVSIRPESVAMTDFAQLQNERVGYMNALSTFLQSASPLMEADEGAKPFLLELLSWGLAGFKGSSEIESVIDKAIEASQNQQEQPKQDPEAMKAQVEMQKIQAKAQADQMLREQDRQADIQTAQAEHQMKMAEIQASSTAKLAEINAKMQADMVLERVQSEINVQQAVQTAGAESQKDVISQQLELEKEATKTALKLTELDAATTAKIRETNAGGENEQGE